MSLEMLITDMAVQGLPPERTAALRTELQGIARGCSSDLLVYLASSLGQDLAGRVFERERSRRGLQRPFSLTWHETKRRIMGTDAGRAAEGAVRG